MRAIILAGGKGSRLLSYVNAASKALIKIGDRTLLECVITNLLKESFKKITVIASSMSDAVACFIRDKLRRTSIDIIEGSISGTLNSYLARALKI